jgi:hypothetical protein
LPFHFQIVPADAIGEVRDMSCQQPGARGILQIYPMNVNARCLTPMSEDQRVALDLGAAT